MKVLTTNPIFVNNKGVINPSDMMYSNLDGKKMSGDAVKAFQYFVNYKEGRQALNITGIWDTNTEKYNKWMPSFDAMLSKYPNSIRNINDRISGAPTSKSTAPSLELMMNTDTATTLQPSANEVAEKKKQGFDWDKATGTWKKVQDSGFVDWVTGIFGKKNQPSTDYMPSVGADRTGYSDKPSSGMSKGAKTALIIGGVALVGVLAYVAFKKK